jgi:Tfp pilus assembly protein PilO
MKNLPKEKRDRILTIAVGTFAMLVGLYYGLIRFQRNALDDLAMKKVEEESRIQNSQRLVSGLTDLRGKLEASQKKLDGIEATMPHGDMYSWIILTMNSFKENGGYKVELPQFSRENPTEVGILPRFPYKANSFYIRGTALYHDFGRFVADFENAFPTMRIQNIQLEPADGNSASAGGTTPSGHSAEETEKLAFRMEVVALVNPGKP